MKTKEQSHRLLSIYILEILNKYTDQKHTMCQKELMQRIYDDYGIYMSRHTCSDYLMELRRGGYLKGTRGVYTPYKFSDEYLKGLYADLVSGKTFSKEEAEQLIEYLMYPKTMNLKKVLLSEDNKD